MAYEAVRFRSGRGEAECDALDMVGADVVDVLVGEAVAAAAREDAGVAVPTDDAGAGQGVAGEPEGDLPFGVVEDVFNVQESMVLRFLDAN